MLRFPLLLVALAWTLPASAQDKITLRENQRILFLGDSNTFAGGHIQYLDAYLLARHPDKRFELINLGLPSETLSGLSEPDHPYPRPHVFERLERALEKVEPDVVIAAYGMNDGIYHPFTKERLKEFQDAVGKLIQRLRRDNIPLVLVTPMPFDARALKGKLLPDGADKYSWMKPHQDYDEVLARYSEWLREMKKPAGVQVVDVHREVSDALAHYRGFSDKTFLLSRDGIHPGPMGHMLAAGALGRSLHLFEPEAAAEMNGREGKVLSGPIKPLVNSADEVRFSWPVGMALPCDPGWKFTVKNNATVKALSLGPVVRITGLPWKKAKLMEGGVLLGVVEADKEGTFSIAPYAFDKFSRRAESVAFFKAVQERQKLLGLAWLTDVGHKRPDTPKGIALKEAQKQAEKLEETARELARPRMVELRLLPE